MPLTAAVPGERRPNQLPGWRFWLTNTVVVPIVAGVSIYSALAGVYSPTWVDSAGAIGGVAAVFAAIYALATWSHGIDLRKAVAGYLLAALLTVPWLYALVIGLLIGSCAVGAGCPS